MMQVEALDTDIETYLARHRQKELLRFLTCGSVDDGKSTLIGRLLHDTQTIYEDQLAAVRKDSITQGTRGGELDLALLTDGLKAEREQGITIDVAYRYFSTEKRKFIIADTPGHEQYTRNMATGASTCQLAIILIDARHGIMAQTKRHSFICSLLGIRHVVVAVNKMDLVGYAEARFEQIRRDYADFAARLELRDVAFIPISALLGDNVVEASAHMPWFKGSPLLNHLETVHIASDRNLIDLRFPVQYVIRPNLDFRGYAGTVASGVIRPGDEVVVLPSRRRSRVKAILRDGQEVEEAFAGLAVTITLADEIDVSRGDMLAPPGNQPRLSAELDAMVVWMHEKPLVPGRAYWIKHTSKTIGGQVSAIRYAIDVNTLHRRATTALGLNEVGRCAFSLNQPLAHDAYPKNPPTGAFIIIDRLTNATVGAAMVLDREAGDRRIAGEDAWSLERSQVVEAPRSAITAVARAARFGQRPATILLTGLSGSGKSSIAYALEARLLGEGRAVTVLDGQGMRRGLSRDLGFSADDRSENLRRSAEVARILNDAGLICIAAHAAPHRAVRAKVREVVGPDRFFEVHVSAPLDVCRSRDAEGLYARADRGEASVPGVNFEYEVPEAPDLTLPTQEIGLDAAVDRLVELLRARGILSA